MSKQTSDIYKFRSTEKAFIGWNYGKVGRFGRQKSRDETKPTLSRQDLSAHLISLLIVSPCFIIGIVLTVLDRSVEGFQIHPFYISLLWLTGFIVSGLRYSFIAGIFERSSDVLDTKFFSFAMASFMAAIICVVLAIFSPLSPHFVLIVSFFVMVIACALIDTIYIGLIEKKKVVKTKKVEETEKEMETRKNTSV
jgi:hypothetical protein